MDRFRQGKTGWISGKRGRRFLGALFLALAAAATFLVLLGGIRESSRQQSLRDTRASFQALVGLVANGLATGYFQWTEFRDGVATGDDTAVAEWIGEAVRGFRFVRALRIEDRSPPVGPYRIGTDGLDLEIDFPVSDSNGEHPLSGKTAAAVLDAAAILQVVQAEARLTLVPEGAPFLYGLSYRSLAPVPEILDLLAAALLALLVGVGASMFFRRQDRFFFESKGLDTIIFLFEKNDHYSAHHSRHVADLTVDLGRLLGFRGRRLKDLRTAALLHDIGKIAVPREVLTKQGALTPQEFAQIQTHADASARILEYFDELAHLAPVVRSHHEKMDGSGYPQGLQGSAIPYESRIIAVADVFEALTGDRPYRSPFPVERAVAELRAMPLDQDIVEVLADLLARRPDTVFRDLSHDQA